ncbi:MAG TPA: GNAT family N-acetyltransferase [Gemmatimonadaceae bacterium]
MHDRVVEQRRGELLLSTDRARIDIDAVLDMLHRSHWGGAITRDILERAIPNSVCIGVYEGARQLAFARAITDLATYAYLSDVIVLEEARGQGLGSWMIEAILSHPDLQRLRRIALFTRDARELYERYGFAAGSTSKSIYMEHRPAN